MSERRLQKDRLPRHVAIIMDGNGRWAEARGLERNAGHREGVEAVKAIVRAANEIGIPRLTLYSFSSENWDRPKGEVQELMRLLDHYLETEVDEVMRNGIRIEAVGRLDRLPPLVRKRLDDVMERSAGNREMTLVFALSYGGRQEIVDAVSQILRDAERGQLDAENMDEKTFSAYLYDGDAPDPDLLIRTGGELRVSNFLLWQIAYAEIHCTGTMWPDFRKDQLVDALLDYQGRERRFGLTSDQVRGPQSENS
ncbi:MAG: isoprenyl transferase [Deltaproteobacteria bacterium]|nr:isoprenyl transferase [Deltaproteobacteria bacterium]MBW2445853.1 isoprenyl transferase [Deltaproteobacteria bacterium]